MSESSARVFVLECAACRQPSGPGAYFCASCGILRIDPEQTSFAASRWSRLGAFALDYLIIWLTIVFWAFSFFDAAWLLWDRDRQTLHDKILGTLVVERSRV